MKAFVGTATDYSKEENWLAKPEKPELDVDVIYLYPSSCMDENAGMICPVDNMSMRLMAKKNLKEQAGVFKTVANIYAPFWRQVNAMKLPKMSFEEVDEAEWAEPRTDVYAALDFYFTFLNQGRPYFLAGHSQGSRLIYMVLSEYMKEHPWIYSNMIAAYCLGDSLTKSYLEANPHVKAAQCADDLGVVVSWNTEGIANVGKKSLVVAPGAVAINPLNWRTDDSPASASLNLGTYKPGLILPGLTKCPAKADAVIYPGRGTVIVTEPKLRDCAITKIPGNAEFESVFGPESYHGCDYSFFYLNIRNNARARVRAWMTRQEEFRKSLIKTSLIVAGSAAAALSLAAIVWLNRSRIKRLLLPPIWDR